VKNWSKHTEIGPSGRESVRDVKSNYKNDDEGIQSDHARRCPECTNSFLQVMRSSSKKTSESDHKVKDERKCRYCQVNIKKKSKYFGCKCDDLVTVCTSCIKMHFCCNNHKCQVTFLEEQLYYGQKCDNCEKYLRTPAIVLVCHSCYHYVCATCAGCTVCHHRSAYGLHSGEVPLFIKSDQGHTDDPDPHPKDDKSIAKIEYLGKNPTVVSWNRSAGHISFAALAFDDTFLLMSYKSDAFELDTCEMWKHKQGHPELATIHKIKWGSHRGKKKDQSDADMMMCMCECSNGIFFFMFDSFMDQDPRQFEIPCDFPVSDYGYLSPYVAFSHQDQRETCILCHFENDDLEYKTSYTKSDINISAISFCPPMSADSTWLSIGATSGSILIVTFSGDESPVCVYYFNQQSFGAVSAITSCLQLTKTSHVSMHKGDWRDQSETSYFCATDETSRENEHYKLCKHGKRKGTTDSVEIIRENHWSCCGKTSKASSCSKQKAKEVNESWSISFASCFNSGVCSCLLGSCVRIDFNDSKTDSIISCV
jgi:hypothetical protein